MLPIPGTSKVAHLEENVAAVNIQLSDKSSMPWIAKNGRNYRQS